MNVRSKPLKIRNLPKGHKRLDQINTKPYLFFSISFLMGVVLILLVQSYLIGGLLVIISLYNFFFIKNEVLVEFYDEYAVFYHTTSYKDDCYLLFWNDVSSWEFHRTKTDYDELIVQLKNHKRITLKCICRRKVKRYFKRHCLIEAHKTVITT